MTQERKIAGCVGKEFFYAYSNLPKHIQKKTREFIEKFSENPLLPGLNYEKLQVSDERVRSVRVDKDYRVILLILADNKYLLLYVDKHDDAYEWVRKRRFDVNEATTQIQIYMDNQAGNTEEKVKTCNESSCNDERKSIFEKLNKADQEMLQISEYFMEQALNIFSEEELYQKREYFPEDIFERLEFWMLGFSAEEIAAELLGGKNASESAGQNAGSVQGNIIVIEEHRQELERMWEAPLDLWRVFLHPSQKKLVEMKAGGPVSISGNPGTGKTVLALHRSVWLAENVCKETGERVLLTTFSKNLASGMRRNVMSMCKGSAYAKIHVCHIDQWVAEFLKEKAYPYRIVYDDVLKTVWTEVFAECRSVVEFAERFYIDEWNYIIVPNEIKTAEAYMRIPRVGRGMKLSREQRKEMWKIFQCVYDNMDAKKVRSFEMAVLDAEKIAAQQKECLYRSIVVDEGQDLSNGVYKLLRTLAGEEKENDIFICSDVRQQIYNRKPILSRCGINVRGRSKRLKISYRISQANCSWSEALLQGQSYVEIDDAGLEAAAISKNYGSKPEVLSFKLGTEEQQFVLKKIHELLNGGAVPESICIVARLNSIIRNCADYLARNSVPAWIVSTDDSNMQGSVHLSTMHKIKGLEYDYIFIICANKDVIPLKVAIDAAGDEVERRDAVLREKKLLYVASTRARKQLFITSVGEMSEFIKGV